MESYIKNINNNTIKKQDYILANSYNIKSLMPDDLREIAGGVVAIISVTSSGKTVFLFDILGHIIDEFSDIYLMSRTSKFQDDYDVFPNKKVIDHYDEKQLIGIWNSQVRKKLAGEKLKKIVVILDDVIADKAYKKSEMINHIAFGARHLFITIIILSQTITGLKPDVRKNIRLGVSFAMDNQVERQSFINQFMSATNSKVGEIVFRNITDTKYQAVAIKSFLGSVPFDEKITKYIANPEAKLKLKRFEKVVNIEPEDIMIEIDKNQGVDTIKSNNKEDIVEKINITRSVRIKF